MIPQSAQSSKWKPLFLTFFLCGLPAILSFGSEIKDAISSGNLQRVEDLLREKPYLVQERDEIGDTPLSWAAYESTDINILVLLLTRKANVNSTNYSNSTPLLYAAMKGKADFVKLLIDHGADINARDKGGDTPLFEAALSGRDAVVKLLIDHGAAFDPEKEDQLLEDAARAGGVETVRLLLEDHANAKQIDPQGATPLMGIGGDDSAKVQIAQLLLDHGADPNLRFTGHLNKGIGGESALWCAARESLPLTALLVEHRADIEIGDRDFANQNIPPLFAAAEADRPEIEDFLLSHGARIDPKDAEGCTPLIQAVLHNNVKAAALLLAKGANIEARDKYGATPVLHVREIEMVKLLLSYHANINARDNQGHTLLENQWSYYPLSTYLLAHGATK